MTTTISFQPKHAQPFTLEQAIQLEVPILVEEIRRLQNSIAHLRETQNQLRSFLEEDVDDDDDGELRKAMKENDETIQTERIALIKAALMNKLGKDALGHYGLDETPDDKVDLAAPTAVPDHPPSDDVGLHL